MYISFIFPEQPPNTEAPLKSINKSNSFIYCLYTMVLFAFYFTLRIGYIQCVYLQLNSNQGTYTIYISGTHLHTHTQRNIINISVLHNRLNSFNNLITHSAPATGTYIPLIMLYDILYWLDVFCCIRIYMPYRHSYIIRVRVVQPVRTYAPLPLPSMVDHHVAAAVLCKLYILYFYIPC